MLLIYVAQPQFEVPDWCLRKNTYYRNNPDADGAEEWEPDKCNNKENLYTNFMWPKLNTSWSHITEILCLLTLIFF